jgi:DNA-directed RNA polymerase subunit RPC12/RpoP
MQHSGFRPDVLLDELHASRGELQAKSDRAGAHSRLFVLWSGVRGRPPGRGDLQRGLPAEGVPGATSGDGVPCGARTTRRRRGKVTDDETRTVETAPAYPPYQDYKCPKCGHEGNDADPHIHHTLVGIICLKCGAKICD